MKRALTALAILLYAVLAAAQARPILIEAESFEQKGGWAVDQQFMDRMGSPYLIAHGMGVPVADASTPVQIPLGGTWYVWVRTFNWTSPWEDPPRKTRSDG